MTMQEPKVQRTAEPLYDEELPKTSCITLDNVISLIAKHGVEIPESEAKQIEDFIEKRFASSPTSHLQYEPPLTPVMESLYRRWFAASRLHWELMEHAERSPKWRNWGVTGQPFRLDVEGRKRAMAMLERMIAYNQDRFNNFLSGRDQLTHRSAIVESAVFDAAERKWLSCLGFETDEILGFLRADPEANEMVDQPSESNPGMSDKSVPNIEVRVGPEMVADNMEAISAEDGLVPQTEVASAMDGMTSRTNKSTFHPLAKLIARAIMETGGDRSDLNAIWSRLVEMASSETPPPPIRQFIERDGVQYLSGNSYKIFKRDALRKQLNPAARGGKKRNSMTKE